MAGAGAPNLSVDASGLRVAIISGSWHAEVMSGLTEDAIATVKESGGSYELFQVAGSFELPALAQTALTPAAEGGGGFDVAVCLGVIVRGGTPHFEYVSSAVTDGLTRVQLDTGRPVGFGVLTTDNDQQAFDRSGLPGSVESKGREAAEAALHLAVQMRNVSAVGRQA